MYQEDAAARVIRCARSWIGTPYRHQASLKGVGCDCLGLLRGIWREVEGREPERAPAYSSTWADVSGREQLLEAAERNFIRIKNEKRQPSDVLLFRLRRNSVVKHVGILSTECRFIHAYSGACVTENSLSEFWERRIAAVFRFPLVYSEGD